MERFNLRKLNDAKAKEQNQVIMSKMFATLENLEDNVDINERMLETVINFRQREFR
jgi:hypothetical protein